MSYSTFPVKVGDAVRRKSDGVVWFIIGAQPYDNSDTVILQLYVPHINSLDTYASPWGASLPGSAFQLV